MTTTGPLRPEEERSKTEQTPEILLSGRGQSAQDIAEALVDKWAYAYGQQNQMTRSDPLGQIRWVQFTSDVKRLMRDDIVAALTTAAASPATVTDG